MVLGKKGFTLAEILIAMGIIGIISAMVIPGLVNNTVKSQNAAILGRVVTAIEIGAQKYIQAKNDEITDGSYVQDLSGIGSDYKDDDLAKYIGASLGSSATSYTPKKYAGGDATAVSTVGIFKFKKIDAEYILSTYSASNASFTDDKTILIDVNGTANEPNAYGKDLFKFTLNKYGKMVPTGTATSCTSSIGDGDECTARVVADGFKINY